jgi:hypothetical protein
MQKCDDKLFLQVAEELTQGIRNEALWTKAFAQQDGDEAKTTAQYILLRVTQLQQQHASNSAGSAIPASPRIAVRAQDESQSKSVGMRWLLIVSLALLFLVLAGIGKKYIGRSSPAQSGEEPSGVRKQSKSPSVENPTQPGAGELLLAGIAVNKENHSISITGEADRRGGR